MDATSKAGRPAKGSIIWRKDQWWVRVSMPDGSRPMIPLGAEIGSAERERAQLMAGIVAAKARAAGLVAAKTPTTLAEWSVDWLKDRRVRGIRSVVDDESRLKFHVLPLIGHRPVATIEKTDLEQVVQTLDARVRSDEIGWKTAIHAWTLVSTMFKDAASSKNLALRVRADNPATGVRGPDTGPPKAKQFLWPSEFSALMACKDVPLKWRQLFALGVYTYMRAGEIAGLLRRDVHLDEGYILVHRSIERSRKRGAGTVTSPKSNSSRRVPIEPAIRPLLEALVARRGGSELLFKMPDVYNLARWLRTYLKLAGVRRTELYETSTLTKPITFHDLRATGITWMIVRGDEPTRVMRRAGHADYKTTDGYVRVAEDLKGSFGTPFPPLPADLYSDDVLDCVLASPEPEPDKCSESLGENVGEAGGIPGDLSANSSANIAITDCQNPDIGVTQLTQRESGSELVSELARRLEAGDAHLVAALSELLRGRV